MTLVLPHLQIRLQRSPCEDRDRTVYVTSFDGDMLTISDWRAGEQRFQAELMARTEHGRVRYEVEAPTLELLDERLREIVVTEAGMNALTTISIRQSVERRAA